MENTTSSFFRVAIVMCSLAILFLAFSGCTGNPAGEVVEDTSVAQPEPHGNESRLQESDATTSTGPVSMTIHSAFKTMKIKDANPISGNIFVIIDTTIENLDETAPYITNETTVDITGGGPITQKVYGKLSNPFYWGSIPPKRNKTGEIVFGVKITTEQFTITLRDEQGRAILTKSIGSIPLSEYDQSPGSESATQESGSAQTLKVVIHSAQKTMKIQDTIPLSGNIYVVINMTIENLADSESFVANENTIDITGGGPMTQKIYDRLENPFFWGSIPPGSSKTGVIVFGVKESTNEFTLTLLDEKKQDILTMPIGIISSGP